MHYCFAVNTKNRMNTIGISALYSHFSNKQISRNLKIDEWRESQPIKINLRYISQVECMDLIWVMFLTKYKKESKKRTGKT
jgi:hypothetical protein